MNVTTNRKSLKRKIAVLVASTGTSSTLRSLIKAINEHSLHAQIKLVIANLPSAPGLSLARENNIISKTHTLLKEFREHVEKRKEYSEKLAEILNSAEIQIAIFAGWPIIVSSCYFTKFKGISINIHPGLIPVHLNETILFPDGTPAPWNRGMMTEKAVQKFLHCTYAGSTIHIATDKADFGPVLQHVFVKVKPNDTVDTLYIRLKTREQNALINVINNI